MTTTSAELVERLHADARLHDDGRSAAEEDATLLEYSNAFAAVAAANDDPDAAKSAKILKTLAELTPEQKVDWERFAAGLAGAPEPQQSGRRLMERLDADSKSGSATAVDSKEKIEAVARIATAPPAPQFKWPTELGYNSEFGPRNGSPHQGIDLTAPMGTPVNAAAGGTVVIAGDNGGGYGNEVVIDHGDGHFTRYAHLSGFDVQVGAHVDQGQLIAHSGNTGASEGPHLHFEIRTGGPDGEAHNPREFISQELPFVG